MRFVFIDNFSWLVIKGCMSIGVWEFKKCGFRGDLVLMLG